MFLFKKEMKILANAVREGRSAHLTGMSGMGASTILTHLERTLQSEGIFSIRFNGRSYASHIEFFPLHEAGIRLAGLNARGSLAGLLDLVSEELQKLENGFVVLDGIDRMDSKTLGILQGAIERTRLPVVHSRTRSLLSMRSAGAVYSLNSGIHVDLSLLDYASTVTIVHDRLGNFPGTEIISRIFAASGGITGLTLAYVDGARASGILKLADQQWELRASNLWNSSAEGWLESFLTNFSHESIDALRHLAVSHHSPGPECTQLTTDTLRSLEEDHLLQVAFSRDNVTYTLFPPALSTYFRKKNSAFERADLDDNDITYSNFKLPRGTLPQAMDSHKESVERELLEKQVEWERDPAVATAIPYLLALFHTQGSERNVEEVLETTPLRATDNPSDVFDLQFLKAFWQGELITKSVDLFTPLTNLFPAWEQTVSIFFQIFRREIPLEPYQLDPEDSRFIGSFPGGDLLIACHAYSSLIAGNVEEATRWIAAVKTDGMLTLQRFGGFTVSLIEFATGNLEAALRDSSANIDAALSALDHTKLLLNSYVQLLAFLGYGRWEEALDVVHTALAFGSPGPIDAVFYRAILYFGALAALMHKRPDACEVLLAEAESVRAAPLPLPGVQDAVGKGIQYLLEGRPSDCSEASRRLSRELSEKGSIFAAVQTLRMNLMTWPEPETLREYIRVSSMSSEPAPIEFIEFVDASFSRPEELSSLALALNGNSHETMAAFILRARLRQIETSQVEFIEAINAALGNLHPEIGSFVDMEAFPIQATGSHKKAILSRREREIALLARKNTNAEIASQLQVSVRTVESHLHSAFKKMNVTSRRDLYEAVSGS